jgi:hypothetical protein
MPKLLARFFPDLDPMDLVSRLRQKQLDPDAMSEIQRMALVKYFMEEQSEFSNVDIGKMIGRHATQVGRMKRKIMIAGLHELDWLNCKTVIYSLLKRKEEIQRRAMAVGNLDLAWRTEVDFVKFMQEVGVIERAPVKHEFELGDKAANLMGRLEKYFAAHPAQTVEEFVIDTEIIEDIKAIGPGPSDKGNGHGNGGTAPSD